MTVDEPIGLLAGWGRYPLIVAQALRENGHPVVCIGFREHADAALAGVASDFRWLGLARLGGAIRFLRDHGVRRAVMAGKIHKVRLFRRGFYLHHVPDWTCLATFFHHFITGRKDRKDDSLLSAVVQAFHRRGIEIVPATDFAPRLLVGFEKLTPRGPTPHQLKDIQFGWHLAKEMGRLDVGQSVCVKGRAVLAVEAVEGTDECIRRAGRLCPQGGFTVIKVAKPQQDMRFDVPTIGLGTLESMVAARAKVLAVEAHRTIVIDRPELARFAARHRLVVVALREEAQCPPEWIESEPAPA